MKRLGVIFSFLLVCGSSACVFDESGVSMASDADASNTNYNSNDNTNSNDNANQSPGCGNGQIESPEACDDGNLAEGDGCSSFCAMEPGYQCSEEPSVCVNLCVDGALSGDETAVDCGGSCPARCAAGEGCLLPADCLSLVCDGTTCTAPTCLDGVTNGEETGVDCGGSCPGRCAVGEGCLLPSDCQSLVCGEGVCAAPTCEDGVTNGDELDVDCGVNCPHWCMRVFVPDASTLAILELNGNPSDSSGNDRHAATLSGDFVTTSWGQGLTLQGSNAQGLDWSPHAGLLIHPYSIEIVLVPDDTGCYQRLFSFSATSDNGWYYCNGFQAYANGAIGGTFAAQVRHYLAVVSTAPDTIDVYLNGVLVGSTNASFTAPPAEALFFQDDNAAGSEFLSGTVDAIRLSAVARTPSEILATQNRLDQQPHVP